MKNKISSLSKVFLVLAATMLLLSLFVPIWSIYLDAPQYPEGLSLQIWAHAIAGDVEIINGLNHYIGMKTLHTDDFVEFILLPYIIVAYALLFILATVIARKRWLYLVFWGFVAFGIIAMVDFWRWEYDYGHNLDPNAAIKVPGMAYQPPLIGFKQLLNFGAYSIPNIGGWLFIGAGALLLVAVLIESKALIRFRRNKGTITLLAVATISIVSCSRQGADPIQLHKDACAFCKMSISDGRFGAEIITRKGRVYKFDDLICMAGYVATQDKAKIGNYYICDFTQENRLINATAAWYIQHESLHSPMGGNVAAFESKEAAEKQAQKYPTKIADWNEISDIVHP